MRNDYLPFRGETPKGREVLFPENKAQSAFPTLLTIVNNFCLYQVYNYEI
jgi:hypothetical protein